MSDLKERWIKMIERDKWMTVIEEALELEQRLAAKEKECEELREDSERLEVIRRIFHGGQFFSAEEMLDAVNGKIYGEL